jgi:hypothetical protein
MKNLNKLFFFFLFTTLSVFAQSPEKISYQAVIRDANNKLLANQTVGMQISILQTTPTGTVVYTETHSADTNINGLVSLEIGAGSTSGTFSSIDWSAGPYFIKTETDPTGGSSYTITGTSQLMSVPFALYATTSGDGITTEQSDAIDANTAKVGYTEALVSANTDVAANIVKIGMPEGTEVGQINYWNGTSWQTINPGNDGAVFKMDSGMPAWVDDFTAPIITILNGTDTIEEGSPWTDAGAYADGGETVIVSGTVDTNNAGTYTIIYTATDTSGNIGTATRTVTVLESIAPVITSGTTGLNLVENSGAGQTVYTITANDAVGVVSFAIGGTDATLLSVNTQTGIVTLPVDPDYETKSSYSFTVTASDAAGNTSDLTIVTFAIVDVDDTAPVITSGITGLNLVENSGAGQTVYTITANDNGGGTIGSYVIGGTDAALLTLTGNIVTLPSDPDYEIKSSYSFTVFANDAEGNTSDSTTVTFSITDVDDTAPVITSGTTGTNLAENAGLDQGVYTITANDAVGVTSYAIGGTDASLLSLAGNVVSLDANPDYETKSSYSFTVTASDAAGNTSDPTTVTFSIEDVDEIAPVITSSTTGVYLINNSGAGQTAYIITADDNGGETITSYAIGGTDAALLSVNSTTGVVTLTANPDYETKSSYSFTVTASNATYTSSPLDVTFFINTNYAIGMEAQGGYIYYILNSYDPGYDPNIQHGLVCAVELQSDGIRWDNGYNQYIGVNDTSIGSGLSNTDAVIAVQSIQAGASDFAARVARDYNGGGYNDWYLPSRSELLYLKNKIYYIPLSISDRVWTSSEHSDDQAWSIDFTYNYNNYIGETLSKRGDRSVIAVRSF